MEKSESDSLLTAALGHLEALVGFDTQNPPRNIDTGGIFDYLRRHLPGFEIEVNDHGAGAVSMLAVRGRPRRLFNVHLDTVPVSSGWQRDPHRLVVENDRAYGLGACDIKGAAAALLAVANASDQPLGLLLTSDEEANDARCVDAFVKACPPSSGRFEAVVVAEPTRTRAVLAHRGIQSFSMEFSGRAGHASARQEPGDSALHQAVEWGHAALQLVDECELERFAGLEGLRFNIGRIEGGIKSNVIAPEARLQFNTRPLPNMDADRLAEEFSGLALPGTEFEETFRGAPLPAGDPGHAERRHAAARALADELGLAIGPAVDFWTEAAKFSAAGYTSFVYGPGDIAQAHTADEWVALDQLSEYAHSVLKLVSGGLA
ncbi:MAG TPA: acetylornithine deacetylase [Wenzhouxiangella sp.]|nr:acetylornithine deacetylase [Wenzhouxiangella sp.]